MTHNINREHEQSLTKQEKIALAITRSVGTMYCFYIFCGIGVGSLVGVITGNAFLGLLFGAFSSYFIQLVLLPLLMIGQNLQQRHAEFLADETYRIAIKEEDETRKIHEKLDKVVAYINRKDKKKLTKL